MVAQVRSLLLRAEVRPAGRLCTCARNKSHVITKGAPRLAVKERTIAAGEKGYCASCAAAMIAKARGELEMLERGLPPSPVAST